MPWRQTCFPLPAAPRRPRHGSRLHAAVFDIDGTLLDSFEEDAVLYVEAIRHVIGHVRIREAWEKYTCVSDTGILAQICQDNDIIHDVRLFDTIREVFVHRLEAHMALHGPCREVPGAREYLNRLRARPDVQVAYATGGWRASAQMKLRSAGFPLEDVPLASADDHHDRRQIMLCALGRLRGPFDTITYYGDGVWDREATAALGWEFVAGGRSSAAFRPPVPRCLKSCMRACRAAKGSAGTTWTSGPSWT